MYKKEKDLEDEQKSLISSWNSFLEDSLSIDLTIEPILTIKEIDSWNNKREQTLNQISNQKELEKINQKFYRISNNGWNNSLGLGLFIVQSVLTLHNFTLEIHSEFKKGSQFCIKY